MSELTNKEKLFLLELKAQVEMGQRQHMFDGTAFYVSAAELQRKFGDNYKRKLNNILEVVTDNYSFNVKKSYTMGYAFTKQAKKEMASWEVEPSQKPKAGEQGKDYFREVVDILKLEHLVSKGPSLFAKPEHYMAAKMYAMSYNKVDGCNWVTYERTAGKDGRRFATSPSLQSLPKVLRQQIALDHAEVDMANCHPMILDALARKYNLSLSTLSILSQNRDTFLQYIGEFFGSSRDDSKRLLLLTCYLASMKYNSEKPNAFTEWVKEASNFESDAWKSGDGYEPVIPASLKNLSKDLKTLACELKDKAEMAPFANIQYDSRRLALTIQAIEDKALEAMEKKCRAIGIEIQALSFDGWCVTDWREMTPEVVKYLEDSLEVFMKQRFDLDVRIPLAIKRYN